MRMPAAKFVTPVAAVLWEEDQLGFGAFIQPTFQIDHNYFCYYVEEY